MTDSIRPKYEELGLLEYENAPSDFEIDWAEITKPLQLRANRQESNEQAKAVAEMLNQTVYLILILNRKSG